MDLANHAASVSSSQGAAFGCAACPAAPFVGGAGADTALAVKLVCAWACTHAAAGAGQPACAAWRAPLDPPRLVQVPVGPALTASERMHRLARTLRCPGVTLCCTGTAARAAGQLLTNLTGCVALAAPAEPLARSGAQACAAGLLGCTAGAQ